MQKDQIKLTFVLLFSKAIIISIALKYITNTSYQELQNYNNSAFLLTKTNNLNYNFNLYCTFITLEQPNNTLKLLNELKQNIPSLIEQIQTQQQNNSFQELTYLQDLIDQQDLQKQIQSKQVNSLTILNKQIEFLSKNDEKLIQQYQQYQRNLDKLQVFIQTLLLISVLILVLQNALKINDLKNLYKSTEDKNKKQKKCLQISLLLHILIIITQIFSYIYFFKITEEVSNFKAFNRINIIKNLELSIQNFQISCLIKLQNPEEGTFFGLKKEELANNINIFKEEFNIYYQKCDFCKGNLQSNACIQQIQVKICLLNVEEIIEEKYVQEDLLKEEYIFMRLFEQIDSRIKKELFEIAQFVKEEQQFFTDGLNQKIVSFMIVMLVNFGLLYVIWIPHLISNQQEQIKRFELVNEL